MKYFFKFTLSSFFLAQFIFAQKINYKHFTEADGLHNLYVYAIKQDKNSFLWIATAEGLLRFDGKSFLNFNTKNGLQENFVNTLFVDSLDRKWIGHYSGGITVFDNNSFKILNTQKLITSRINIFFQNKNGEILVGTQSDGLWIINSDLSIKKITTSDSEFPIINDIQQINENQYLLATNEGLISISIDNRTNRYTKKTIENTDYYQIISILKIKNQIVYATEYDGIFGIDFKNSDTYRTYKLPHNLDLELSGKIIFIDKDKNNHIYISYENGNFSQNKLLAFSIEQNTSYNISKDKFSTFCKSMYVDKEDNLWIGTFGNGLLQSSGNVFLSYSNSFDYPQENVTAIAIKADVIYYAIGSELYKYDIKKELYTKLTYHISSKEAQTEEIKHILIDENDIIYISIENKGLYSSSLKKMKFKEFFCHLEDKPSCTINNFIKDENFLWLATDNGAYQVNLSSQNIKRIGIENGLPHNKVYTIKRDSKNRIWFATHSSGISYFEFGKLFKIHSPLENVAVNISTIYEDKNKDIWFGTYGRGIMRYKNGEFDKQFSKFDGMGSDFCYTISEDNNGFLWVGHKNGFSKINIETSEINFYENITEYSDAEVNLNAVCNDPENEVQNQIWYGTNHGLLKFDSENDRKNIIENSNVITGLKLFFNEPEWNKLKVRKQITSPPQNINFKHSDNHFTFEFIGISLKSPENVKYKFFLEGFENDWSLESKQNYATYSNLPSGTYTFKVISKNKDGKWNKIPTTYSFQINKPFWKEWWFILLSFLLFLFIIFIVYYFRTLNLRNKNALLLNEKLKLEYEISERKIVENKLQESQRLLQLSHDELNEFMWRLYHDLKSPLKSIRGLVNIALAAPPKIEDSQKYYGLIGLTTDKLDAILTDFSKIKILTDFEFSNDLIDFKVLFDNTISQIKLKHDLTNFSFKYLDQTKSENFYTDYSSLEMIFNNVIRNCVMYASANPIITVRIKSYSKFVSILIVDNGIGIEKIALSKVFNMFYKASERSKGTGLGLYITKKYVEIIKGEIGIVSTKNKGTMVRIKIPSIPPLEIIK
ncbi:MAG: hypothetical protein EAZ27_05080 [Cytophagales bacterium]|nr:MAG: hypothetical protein EAZ27_05080 [Cytophagales bacterium]